MSSNTPTKVKRAVQDRQGTPIVPKKKRKSEVVGCYNPPVASLRRNYDAELGKFLQSALTILNHIESSKTDILLPLRRQLSRHHKQSSHLHLYFKSLTYWKSFYTSFITENDKIMDCFRFDDLRSVDQVVTDHRFPVELVSFVTQQLMEWRELFKNVGWMKTYRELTEKLVEEEKKHQEQAERNELIREITLILDMNNLKIADSQHLAENPAELHDELISKVSQAQKSNELSKHLKNVPSLSRRVNTREWCRKHHESPSMSSSSSASDDESTSSSSDGNSSIYGDGNTSAADLTSSSEGDMDSFFGPYGL